MNGRTICEKCGFLLTECRCTSIQQTKLKNHSGIDPIDYLRILQSRYPFSKKITRDMVYKKYREILDQIRITYPGPWQMAERNGRIMEPKAYLNWQTPVENFGIELTDEFTLKIIPTTEQEEEYEYSDILYWESVHDGDINPDEEIDPFENDDPEIDFFEKKLTEVDQTITMVQEILHSNLSDYLKSKALIQIAGLGIKEFDQLANPTIKEIIRNNMGKVGEKLGLTVKNSAYKVWLEDHNKKRFLSISIGVCPADVFEAKEIDFYGELTKEKMEIAIHLLELTGYEFNQELKNTLLSSEQMDSWSNYSDKISYNISVDFLMVSLSNQMLYVRLGNGGGPQSL